MFLTGEVAVHLQSIWRESSSWKMLTNGSVFTTFIKYLGIESWTEGVPLNKQNIKLGGVIGLQFVLKAHPGSHHGGGSTGQLEAEVSSGTSFGQSTLIFDLLCCFIERRQSKIQ